MSETLLDLIQQAADELAIDGTTPSTVIGNTTDEFTRTLLAQANAAGRDLARRYEWGGLMTLATIPTVPGQSDYSLPADFYRMVNDTTWDTSTGWSVPGPLTPQAEQYLLDSQAGVATIYRQFRQIGRSTIRITPMPTDASGRIVFKYLSRNWVVLQGGSLTANTFANDTDTTVFDFDLMVRAVKWRWRSAKGFDASEAKAEYDDALQAIMAADQGGGTLNMGGWYEGMGGQAFGVTDQNFRISDGSGNYLVAEVLYPTTPNPLNVTEDTETFIIGNTWVWILMVQTPAGDALDLTPYSVAGQFYTPGYDNPFPLTVASGAITITNPTSGQVTVSVPASLTSLVQTQAPPVVPSTRVEVIITDAYGNPTTVGILSVLAIIAPQA